jgi:hypothetical protein
MRVTFLIPILSGPHSNAHRAFAHCATVAFLSFQKSPDKLIASQAILSAKVQKIKKALKNKRL